MAPSVISVQRLHRPPKEHHDNPAATSPAAELKLGYFGNITHAPALVGVNEGFIEKNLGTTKLSTEVFIAGPAASRR